MLAKTSLRLFAARLVLAKASAEGKVTKNRTNLGGEEDRISPQIKTKKTASFHHIKRNSTHTHDTLLVLLLFYLAVLLDGL